MSTKVFLKCHCNGCTCHIHMQTEDKDRVQDYVGDSADQYKGGGTCPEPEQKIFFRQEKEQGQHSGEDHSFRLGGAQPLYYDDR